MDVYCLYSFTRIVVRNFTLSLFSIDLFYLSFIWIDPSYERAPFCLVSIEVL